MKKFIVNEGRNLVYSNAFLVVDTLYQYPSRRRFYLNSLNDQCYADIIVDGIFKEEIGDLFNTRFVIEHTMDDLSLERIEFYCKNFKFQTSNSDLFINIFGKWNKFNFFFKGKESLFDEFGVNVSCLVDENVFLVFKSGNFTFSWQERLALEFAQGTLPKDIYCDYVKESDFYNYFVKNLNYIPNIRRL